ncbi:MAG: DMT family transporter [Alphaproteobacteria bacterium]|nr:DMT family transporter [Alphaproteobacteria bacterium]
MRLALTVALTMVAFAANSILNRLALVDGAIGPVDFAALRVLSGAVALCGIVWLRGGQVPFGLARRPWAALALALYMLGFSFAYLTLDAGVGALILFGGVQITMFAGGLIAGERPPLLRWIGAGIALGGLVWLLWPMGAARPDGAGVALMAAAAFGWGIYSLLGRSSGAPLPATAANFALIVPLMAVVWWFASSDVPATAQGIGLALISGMVTSGLGYALWYSVLPRLEASTAALSQLTVPVIAALGGVLFLSEGLTLRAVIAGALVIGGVALGTRASSAKIPPAKRQN